MRVKSVLRKLLGLRASAVVIVGLELVEDADGGRPKLVVKVRRRARQRGRCGRCGAVAPWFDNGGGERRWRHLDVGFATCELVADAPRVSCPTCGVTVAEVSFARHDSAFTRAFEDVVVVDAICSSKLAPRGCPDGCPRSPCARRVPSPRRCAGSLSPGLHPPPGSGPPWLRSAVVASAASPDSRRGRSAAPRRASDSDP